MEQKDYILREIEKISVMLRGILGWIAKRKDEQVHDQYDEVRKELIEAARIDLEEFIHQDINNVDKVLSRVSGFNSLNIECFADILAELEIPSDKEKEVLFKEKAIALYEYVNRIENTFSFDRESKVARLRAEL